MKTKIISGVTASVLSCLTLASYSAPTQTPAQLARQLQRMSAEAASLQKEMQALKTELRQLKQAKRAEEPSIDPETRYQRQQAAKGRKMPFGVVHDKEGSWSTPLNNWIDHGPTVTTSPYLGLRSAFDASDLLVNLPSMGEDLRLLRQRDSLIKSLKGAYPYAERPVLELSGKIEGLAFSRSHSGGLSSQSDIDLAAVELDVLAEVSPWVLGFMSFNYSSAPLDPSLTTMPVGSRISNSNLFLKRGFITVGNLNHSPWYFSTGQMYADFGRYSSALVSSPMTLVLGRVNARQLSVGYAKEDGFSASLYAFKGDTNTGNAGIINQGGANVRYKHDYGNGHKVNAGIGIISNIADSAGMQDTGLGAGSGRQGFGVTPAVGTVSANERLVHRVPAIDLHAEVGLGPWSIMAEYIAATRTFSPLNMTYNAAGAKPSAFHIELNRAFDLFDKPANASIAYDRSMQAYAVGLPRDSFIGVFNISPFKNTIAALEFRHDRPYPAGTTGIIKGKDVPAVVQTPSTRITNNTLAAQFGIYF